MAKPTTVIKRDGSEVPYDENKILEAIRKAFFSCGFNFVPESVTTYAMFLIENMKSNHVEDIQDAVQTAIMANDYYSVAVEYIKYRDKHNTVRDFARQKAEFIDKYKKSFNTADSTIDDNSNVANKNIAVLNTELYKENNVNVNRYRVMQKLREMYPDFDAKQYLRDIESHIIYKNDENSTFGFPYCVAVTMYPFLTDGIKKLGGLSAAPKNIDSFCGMFVNFVFAVSSQFAGAVATAEFLLCFDWFARKEWGDDYYMKPESVISLNTKRVNTIERQIDQYFQQVVYSINQPSAARGFQSAFWNVSIFDKAFYNGMFGSFIFPDGTKPKWESLEWLQKHFMKWLNKERLRTILTFPVVSVSLLYNDNEFADKNMASFVAEEYSEGDSFSTYISDSVDSLSSCCRLKNKIQTHEFNFTNGNIGVMTGSKSVITINMNRIIQNFRLENAEFLEHRDKNNVLMYDSNVTLFKSYLSKILDRVYKYHTAYNELLYDLYDANLLPVYKAGFISLDKQYLTVGISGFTASAENLGIDCNDTEEYSSYCKLVFETIKEQNALHNTRKTNYNTELIPAESAGVKLYNWDKSDGYDVPEDINLYTSYIFKPYDNTVSVLEKIRLHGSRYIGDYLDGGAACHMGLSEHLSKKQYEKILKYAAENGCQYFTFNVPNCECEDCGFIAKQPFDKCPKCGSTNVSLWDRIIGYLTKVKNWSEARRIEQKKRVYSNEIR